MDFCLPKHGKGAQGTVIVRVAVAAHNATNRKGNKCEIVWTGIDIVSVLRPNLHTKLLTGKIVTRAAHVHTYAAIRCRRKSLNFKICSSLYYIN